MSADDHDKPSDESASDEPSEETEAEARVADDAEADEGKELESSEETAASDDDGSDDDDDASEEDDDSSEDPAASDDDEDDADDEDPADASDDDDASEEDDDSSGDAAASDDDGSDDDDDASEEDDDSSEEAAASDDDDASEEDDDSSEEAAASEEELGRKKKPPNAYPPADEQTLRKAGAGCLIAFFVLLAGIYGLFHWTVASMTSLNSDGIAPRAPAATHDGESDVPPLVWVPDLQRAATIASAESRPLMVFVRSGSDARSVSVRDELFQRPSMRALAANFVPVEIDLETADAPTRVALQHLGVSDVPLIMTLNSNLTRLSEDVTRPSPAALRRALESALRASMSGARPPPAQDLPPAP